MYGSSLVNVKVELHSIFRFHTDCLYLRDSGNKSLERLRITFTANGKREFASRDQAFPLIVIYCVFTSTQK